MDQHGLLKTPDHKPLGRLTVSRRDDGDRQILEQRRLCRHVKPVEVERSCRRDETAFRRRDRCVQTSGRRAIALSREPPRAVLDQINQSHWAARRFAVIVTHEKG